LPFLFLRSAIGFCYRASNFHGDSIIMTKLARAISLVLVVLIFLLSVGFSFFNTQQVALSFGFLVLAPQPVALWVLSAFVIGGFFGLALGARRRR